MTNAGFVSPGEPTGRPEGQSFRLDPERQAQLATTRNLLQAGLPNLPQVPPSLLPTIVPITDPDEADEAMKLGTAMMHEMYFKARANNLLRASGWLQMYQDPKYTQGMESVRKPAQRLAFWQTKEPIFLEPLAQSLAGWLQQPDPVYLAPYWQALWLFNPATTLRKLQDYYHVQMTAGSNGAH